MKYLVIPASTFSCANSVDFAVIEVNQSLLDNLQTFAIAKSKVDLIANLKSLRLDFDFSFYLDENGDFYSYNFEMQKNKRFAIVNDISDLSDDYEFDLSNFLAEIQKNGEVQFFGHDDNSEAYFSEEIDLQVLIDAVGKEVSNG